MTNLSIEKQKGSTVLITGELPWDEFKAYRPKALSKLGELVEISGFRKGHIPEDVLLKKVGELAVLEEMASLAFQVLYPEIILKEKIEAIGRPSIQITKLAEGNPLGFSITTAILPEVSLPDYKKIAHEINAKKVNEDVTDEEVEKTIEEIRTMRAKQDLFKTMQKNEPEHVHDENCDNSHDEIPNNKDESIEDIQKRIDEKLVLPEFNDEFVKSLGEFSSTDEFKIKLKENLAFEKERRAKDKLRIDMVEKMVEETKLDIPQIMVDREVDQIIHSMKDDITRMGMTFEKYLEGLGKTEEDLRTSINEDGKKRASVQVIVASIARKENIHPDEETIAKEVAFIKQHYKDADDDSVRAYVETVLTNDLVFKFLDQQ